jgi:putative tryptophan/tyrosine transport system substrate-binding protein
VIVDYRYAPAGAGAQALAKELIAVILSPSTPSSAALKRETSTVPVVFVGNADPISSGFVESLARPGGNLTGFLLYEESITSKWLAMLKEIAPAVTRVALVSDPRQPEGCWTHLPADLHRHLHQGKLCQALRPQDANHGGRSAQ